MELANGVIFLLRLLSPEGLAVRRERPLPSHKQRPLLFAFDGLGVIGYPLARSTIVAMANRSGLRLGPGARSAAFFFLWTV